MNFGNMGLQQLTRLELSNQEFNRVRHMVYEYCGINLQEGKEALVRARLMKRLRSLKMQSFSDYLDYVESEKSGLEFVQLIDVLTTNKTSFFRESQHFNFIQKVVIPEIEGRNVKWWSAGCSSGEEAVTLAITFNETIQNHGNTLAKILGTDISTGILKTAKEGRYGHDKLQGMPREFLKKYFHPTIGEENSYQVSPGIMKMIKYGRLNLLEPWPLKGPFQMIMCRNVMIYFDKDTQERLVSRFHGLLDPGGYLFIGHSESVTKKNTGFTNIQPAVYKKTGD